MALNPKLYRSLHRAFRHNGGVRISNEGQHRVVTIGPNGKEQTVSAGEQYSVRCPYCRDPKHHLSVSYQWNTSKNGKPYGRGLVTCWRRGCQKLPDFDLESLLRGYTRFREELPPPPPDALADIENYEFREVPLPGTCVPLSSLDEDHPARKYIVERGMDPVELTDLWRLSYCMHHESKLFSERLVVPIYRDDLCVGWQARAVRPETEPRYVTMPGFRKSFTLFNCDRARQLYLGVLVEGVFDAFAVGVHAAALFGKTASARQLQLIRSYWGRGAVCILLDEDAPEEADKLYQALGGRYGTSGGVFIARLKDDPGSTSKEEIWSVITAHARAAGVDLASSCV